MSTFADPATALVAAFLTEIGLVVEAASLPAKTFLPGIRIDHGTIVIDEARLLHPGDVLHEAGHLAVVEPARRATIHGNVGNDPAEEMMAIGWSYAAALHMHLDPAAVFHDHGYRGSSAALLDNFANGRYLGVPMLQWVGMTLEPRQAAERGVLPYPHMLCWLRPA